MKNRYVFQFAIGNKPIFEKEGEYFISQFVDSELLAFGLYTDDPEGFEPVNDICEYEKIQELSKTNARLRLLSIVGLDKDIITVVVEFAGEYEYFRLTGIKLMDISDELAAELCTKVNQKRQSRFSKPYNIEMAGNKIKSIK